jgi:NAD(P)-dependent dehydrogenase (short-subunit alcohol dehydrogenase family)
MSQTVLVTGCSSGFGKLIARTLLSQGHTVAATMRDPEGRNSPHAQELRDLAATAPGKLHVLELDVTDASSVDAAVGAVLDAEGAIDVVVNNAGYGAGGLAEGFTEAQWRQMFEVNVFGVQRVNRAVLPSMRRRGAGLLIHVSSMMGRIVLPFSAPYTASKYALEALAETYRYELAGLGVDVVIVEPGGFGTGFGENMAQAADGERVASYGDMADAPGQFWSGILEQLQGGEAPDPQLVADAVAELVAAQPGERPFRTVVDPLMGGEPARVVNGTVEQVQRQLFEGFGMGSMLGVEAPVGAAQG